MESSNMKTECLLDLELFDCRKCGRICRHTEGTWLPDGVEDKSVMRKEEVEYLTVLHWSDWLKPPEVITSELFTCYDCT